MSVNRTIYTQGAVQLFSGVSGIHSTETTGNGFFFSGVQSANFTANSPKMDVNAFGILGPINKVAIEPETATLEISLVVNSGNSGNHFLSGLVKDANRPTPSGCIITASGVGQLKKAILTSFRLEASVGALPTLAMTFEGVSGDSSVMSGVTAATTPNTAVVSVFTPANFGSIFWNTAGTDVASGCPQTIRASWEMPVERLNCLGTAVNDYSLFSRPPGTMSFTAEGIDYTMLGNYITGVKIGLYTLKNSDTAIKETSRSVNMAIGEAAATFNITSEGVALGAIVDSE